MADPYIEVDASALSPTEAEQALVALLKAYGLTMTPEVRAGAHMILLNDGRGKTIRLGAPELMTQLHLTGACEIDRLRWRDTDPHGSVSMEVPEGITMVIGTAFRNSPQLHGPGYATNDVVTELLEDLMLYREQVVVASCPGTMYRPAFRAYRSYLAAGVSAIDAYLNRLSWFARNEPGSPLSAAENKLLARNALPLDEKIRRWLPLISGGAKLLETTPEWSDYQAFKSARNAVVHASHPEFLFAPREAAEVLNLCRRGVGGPLAEIGRLLNREPAPAVVRVARARLARYRPHL